MNHNGRVWTIPTTWGDFVVMGVVLAGLVAAMLLISWHARRDR